MARAPDDNAATIAMRWRDSRLWATCQEVGGRDWKRATGSGMLKTRCLTSSAPHGQMRWSTGGLGNTPRLPSSPVPRPGGAPSAADASVSVATLGLCRTTTPFFRSLFLSVFRPRASAPLVGSFPPLWGHMLVFPALPRCIGPQNTNIACEEGAARARLSSGTTATHPLPDTFYFFLRVGVLCGYAFAYDMLWRESTKGQLGGERHAFEKGRNRSKRSMVHVFHTPLYAPASRSTAVSGKFGRHLPGTGRASTRFSSLGTRSPTHRRYAAAAA